MESEYELIVIGAGIAGLTLARTCAQAGLRVAVFEAQSRIGGCMHSARFSLKEGDYWLELGAHTLFGSYGHLLQLLTELKLDSHLQTRWRLPYRIWRDGEMRSIVGSLHWIDFARTLPRAFLHERAGRSVGDYFAALAGTRNYRQVIGPALDALLCQPAGEFPADLLFKKRQRQRGYPRSFTLSQGVSLLVEEMANGLDLHASAAVTRIARAGRGFVCTIGGHSIFAQRLALAVPAAEAARLLRAIEPMLAERLSHISMADVDSTGVVLPASATHLRPMAGLVGRDAPFYSMVSRDVVPDPAWRGFTFHFRPGLNEGERLAEIARVLEVDPSLFTAVVHAHHTLPALRIGHAARMTMVDDLLQGKPLALAGNYFGGLSLEDCVARAQREGERLVSSG